MISPEPQTEFVRLINAVRAGEPQAHAVLFEQYGAAVRAAVRRQLDPRLRKQFDSIDFVQDVWTSFMGEPLRKYEFLTPAALIGFLCKVARDKLVDATRRHLGTGKRDLTRDCPLAADGNVFPADDRQATPSQLVIADERWAELIASLPPGQRAILERLRDGHTQSEIAEQLGISLSTVARVVRRLKDICQV